MSNIPDGAPGALAAVVGHGDFPKGLLSAAERIVGKQEGIVTISNEGLGTEELTRLVRTELDGVTSRIFVFVDLKGGSTYNVCRELMSSHKDWVLIAGVNLPMMLTFLSYRQKLNQEELLGKVLEAGRRGMEKFINH